MRLYRAGTISISSASKALAHIEKFTFQFNAVTQSRGGGGIANMYARLAKAVHDCDNPQRFAVVLKEIRTKLADRIPEPEEFSLAFSQLAFTSSFTRDRALVRYVLRKLSEHFGLPPEIDSSQYTIEHLLAESSASTQEELSVVGTIGNLLYVPTKANDDMKTKGIKEKKSILKKYRVPIDPYLRNQGKWSTVQIQRRTEQLAETAYTKVWKI